MMYAPSTAPATVGAISSAVSRRPPASSRRYAHADASDPGAIATALVAFAIGDGSPHAIATGNDSNVPPPATAFTAPASADAPSSRPSRAGSTAPIIRSARRSASVRAANDFERPDSRCRRSSAAQRAHEGDARDHRHRQRRQEEQHRAHQHQHVRRPRSQRALARRDCSSARFLAWARNMKSQMSPSTGTAPPTASIDRLRNMRASSALGARARQASRIG